MIEVEKKFILDENNKNRLTNGAEFLNKKIFTDIYYDTKEFTLTSQDKWLRSREGRFELKLPLHSGVERLVDQYNELENESEIKEALNFDTDKSLADNLKENDYASFCICKTTRSKYKKGLFIIDLDVVDFQEFTYAIGEIELMVNKKSEIKEAINKIVAFAKENNLKIATVRGKIIEYLKRVKLEHYQALIKTGVVKDS
ncbi:MAG: CYTH domain-containing protein [Patescibacteria group bacterium]|nr:CYTH domain-containing protein [Patescibacteria group bacterium]